MTGRGARWTASVALAVSVGCATAAVAVGARRVDVFVENWGVLLVIFGAFAAVGWLVTTRRPGNPVGWLLLLVGGLPLVLSLVQTLAELMLATQPDSSVGAVLAWLGELPWLGIWGAFALVLLLFPTGRPASPAWRWIVGAAVAITATATLVSAVALWPVRTDLAGAGVLVVGAVAVVVTRNVTGAVPAVLESATLVGIASVPVAMGVAILRYRLYDIDRIASRTASYALLTGVLGATYVAAVLLFGRLLAPLGASGDLAVAAATLTAAALFSPARRHIQGVVDRRFNRAHYDAELVVARFRARLRDEVDLDEVGAALEEATRRTIQPAALACWVQDPESMR